MENFPLSRSLINEFCTTLKQLKEEINRTEHNLNVYRLTKNLENVKLISDEMDTNLVDEGENMRHPSVRAEKVWFGHK